MKERITLKNIVRVICIILEVICLLPTFMVSCSGRTVEVNAYRGVVGYSDTTGYGDSIDGNIICLLLFIIPIVIFILFCLKRIMPDILTVVISIVAVIGDICIWIAFDSGIEEVADYYLCDYEKTGWYTFNMILLIIMLILLVLALFRVLKTDAPLFGEVGSVSTSKGENAPIININIDTEKIKQQAQHIQSTIKAASDAAVEAVKMQNSTNQNSVIQDVTAQDGANQNAVTQNSSVPNSDNQNVASQDVLDQTSFIQQKEMTSVGFCSQCGAPMKKGAKFCFKCGAEKLEE